jgi:arginine decarboxylase
MKIYLSAALGHGKTALAAFDHALVNTGTANYNLVRLSSVIPPNSDIVQLAEKVPPLGGSWGDRLYVVYADARTAQPGEEVWAGIGWVQDPLTKKGLFVEHEGHSEQQVRSDIKNSLTGLLKNRDMQPLDIHMSVTGGVCQDEPLCAFAVAVYQVSDWENGAHLPR